MGTQKSINSVCQPLLQLELSQNMEHIQPASNGNNTNLYPIRIDASTKDKGVRLIDTIIYDPTCPPCINDHNNNSNNEKRIEYMAQNLTDTFLADMEVYNMVRSTSKHYSGRINLLGRTELYKEVQQQIRNQLYAIEHLYNERKEKRDKKKRKRDNTDDSKENDNTNDTADGGDSNSTISKYQKIQIRIKNGEAQINDEFYWDTSNTNTSSIDTCPITMANIIANDLSLSPEHSELAVDIATAIVEQLNGVPVTK